MGLIKVVLIFTMIWYILKIVTRFAFPIFAKRFMSKMEEKIKQQQGFNEKYDASKIGKTVIDKKSQDKTSNNNVGEYVDFEEVD